MPSIPTLIAQLDDPITRKIAISALIDLGPDAVEEVSTAMLASDNLERKTHLAFVLGKIGDPRAAQAVFEVAKGIPPQYRYRAYANVAQALCRMQAVSLLIDLYHHSPDDYRKMVVTELSRIKDSRVVDTLKQALSDKDAWVRSIALKELSQRGISFDFADLVPFFNDSASWVLRPAIKIGFRVAHKQMVQWLATALSEGNSAKRGLLLSGINHQFAVPKLISSVLLCLKDPDPDVRLRAWLFLRWQHCVDLFSTLLDSLNDIDWQIRQRISSELCYLWDPRAMDALLQGLNDANPYVRREIVEAIGAIQEPDAIPFLCAHLEVEADKQVRESVVYALANIDTQQAMEIVFQQIPVVGHSYRHLITPKLAKWISPKGLDQVLENFDFADNQTRATFAQMLGLMQEISAIDLLAKALNDPDLEVALEAAEALAKIGSDEAVEVIQRFLSEPTARWYLIIRIFNEFADRKNPALLDAMISTLRDDDGDHRKHVINALGRLGDPRSVIPLVELLSKPIKGRYRVARALGQICAIEATPALIHAVQEGYQSDAPELTGQAAWALGQLRSTQAVPDLIQVLHIANRNDDSLLVMVCEVLGRIADPRAVDELIAVLDREQDAPPRQMAIWALGKICNLETVAVLTTEPGDSVAISMFWQIKTSSAVSALASILEDEQDAGWRAAFKALRQSGHPQAIPPLLKALSNPSPKIRKLTGKALVQTGAAAIAPLLDLPPTPDPLRRRQIVWILGKIGGAGVVEKLADALNDPDWRVRYKAAQALGKIKDGVALQALEKALNDPALQVRVPARAVLGKG